MGHASAHALYGVLLIACGLVSLLFPGVISFFWDWDWWGWSWSDRETEPPELAVFVIRVVGVIAVTAGIAILLGWSAHGLSGVLPF